jgi:hypothetical protein
MWRRTCSLMQQIVRCWIAVYNTASCSEKKQTGGYEIFDSTYSEDVR